MKKISLGKLQFKGKLIHSKTYTAKQARDEGFSKDVTLSIKNTKLAKPKKGETPITYIDHKIVKYHRVLTYKLGANKFRIEVYEV